jgi:hypothetical protein
MKLLLDATQRLNLHALIGAQRCSVDEVRASWRLQDQIDLSEAEKREIDWKLVGPPGQEQPTWKMNGAALREFDFSADDYGRIKKVMREWQQGFVTSPDRRWLEPLLDQMDANDKPAARDATVN